MRILVLSDSHLAELPEFLGYDEIVHCGDYGRSKMRHIRYVRGNCDMHGEKELCLELFERRVWITHGDLYGVKYGYDRLIYRALEIKAEICFFGHTHRPDMFVIDKVIFLNPGAFKDGYYVEIDEDCILFYKDKRCYKKFEFKW